MMLTIQIVNSSCAIIRHSPIVHVHPISVLAKRSMKSSTREPSPSGMQCHFNHHTPSPPATSLDVLPLLQPVQPVMIRMEVHCSSRLVIKARTQHTSQTAYSHRAWRATLEVLSMCPTHTPAFSEITHSQDATLPTITRPGQF